VTNPESNEIDYFRSEAVIADPYPHFDRLREQCPVRREPHHGVVMVTGYEEATAVYVDPKTFSSCIAMTGPFPGFPVPLEGDDVSDLIEAHRDELPMSRELTTMDPPKHTAHRALAARYFTPRNVSRAEVFMSRLADQLIDGFVDRGECDLTTDFAGPFTVLNICELLGVAATDHQMFLDEMLGAQRDRGIGGTGTGTPKDPFAFLHERFKAYVEDRLATPRDDMITSLATTPFPDGSLPEVMDAVRLASILFVAGTGTTALLLATAFRLLGERPDLQRLLHDEPERIANFVEEVLRYEGPVKGGFRLSRVPTTVGGVELPAGSTVMVALAAANHDPRKFERPGEFLVDRENARQHLAFGHGIHMCVGAPLARAEGRIGVHRLLERLGEIRISETAHGPAGARRFDYVPSYITRGLQALHLEFTPADR
jgi:cytochrome P450